MGAHQKIDRVARKHLEKLLSDNDVFPDSAKILHFEGKNGPDAIKRKSPAKDEPWHYYNPHDDQDTLLPDLIAEHYQLLVKWLKENNRERVAFEAAWLAHALVDGLTPAHHYPYEEKLVELRGGEGIETRTTIKDKLLLPGATTKERMKNNFKMWGPKGLFTTHGLFEMGIASLIAPLSFVKARPTQADITAMRRAGIVEVFRSTAREIAALDMYERYYKRGWTTKLIVDVKQVLAPAIIQTVTLAWYSALVDAGKVEL
jgi:hypothetical protein